MENANVEKKTPENETKAQSDVVCLSHCSGRAYQQHLNEDAVKKVLWCDHMLSECSSETFWTFKEVSCRKPVVPGTSRCKDHPLPQ